MASSDEGQIGSLASGAGAAEASPIDRVTALKRKVQQQREELEQNFLKKKRLLENEHEIKKEQLEHEYEELLDNITSTSTRTCCQCGRHEELHHCKTCPQSICTTCRPSALACEHETPKSSYDFWQAADGSRVLALEKCARLKKQEAKDAVLRPIFAGLPSAEKSKYEAQHLEDAEKTKVHNSKRWFVCGSGRRHLATPREIKDAVGDFEAKQLWIKDNDIYSDQVLCCGGEICGSCESR